MKRRAKFISMAIFTLTASSNGASAGEWVGPDILNFSSSGWTTVGGNNFTNWGWSTNADGGCRKRWGVGTTVDTRHVKPLAVLSEKRYRITGNVTAHDGNIGGNIGDIRTRMEVPGLAATPWQNSGQHYHTVEGIAPVSNVEFRLVANIVSITYPTQNPGGGFECLEMRQVIRDPQMDIFETALETQTDAPNSDFATIEIQMFSTSNADEPTTWEIDWGDGVVEQFPSLNGPESHTYQLVAGEDMREWIATLTGNNIAGIGQDTVAVVVTRRPPCPADLTGDGMLNFFDVSTFLTFYQLGDLTVDFTGDGELNFFDVSAFLNAFTAGCP